MARTLRSKRLRYLLWKAANGQCQICGAELGEDWQADHIVPWIETHRTNVHEMQALCAGCNRRKGTLALRTHQGELEELMKQIEAKVTPTPKFICSHTICGGGKSALPIIAAHWLKNRIGLIDKVCWVVPNGTLREQAATEFGSDKWIGQYLNHGLSIMESTNEKNPTKGTAGYTTTYHALRADQTIGEHAVNKGAFDLDRYLLILDEAHHIALNSPFHRAVMPLVERAKMVLLMTGTRDRADRQPVAFMRYVKNTVDIGNYSDFRWIRYGIRDAIRERAIIRVHFQQLDGAARWEDSKGNKYSAETLGNDRDALFTSLKTEYAFELLDNCADHWISYRRSNPRSKLLVVCADVQQAREMLKHLKARGIAAKIATYREDDADASIREFKNSDTLNALVTVAKAYEGLDVPAITHLACLTQIRSRAWIEQMIGRAWRFDEKAGSWDLQVACIFVPDDEPMQEVIRGIEEEQEQAIREGAGSRRSEDGEDGELDQVDRPDPITPLRSRGTAARATALLGESISVQDTRIFQQVIDKLQLGLTPLQIDEIERALRDVREGVPGPASSRPEGMPELTPRQRLDALKKQLNQLVREIAHKLAGSNSQQFPDRIRDVNTRLINVYGPREALTEDQVLDATEWLRRVYSLDA